MEADLLLMSLSQIRSLCNKIPTLTAIVNTLLYDILIFTVTWITNNITNTMLSPTNNYNLYRLDRLKCIRGGGILLYIKSSIPVIYLNEFFVNDIELLCIKIFHYRIVVIYRHPSMAFDDTIKLCTIITNIYNSPDSCIMFGDFNFPGIHWLSESTTKREEAFYKTIQGSALLQLFNFNIRSGNMLDLILTNNNNLLFSIDYTNPLEYDKHISDHLSIICNILKPESQSFINNQITSVPSLNFNKANFFNIKFELINLDWKNILYNCINCDVAINKLISIVIDMCSKHTPITKKNIYKYPLNINILLNTCRNLHKNVKDQSTHKQWRDC